MPPEEIERLARESGYAVQHDDGYSVVHTPVGPMTVAHSAPVPTRPAVEVPHYVTPTTSALGRLLHADAVQTADAQAPQVGRQYRDELPADVRAQQERSRERLADRTRIDMGARQSEEEMASAVEQGRRDDLAAQLMTTGPSLAYGPAALVPPPQPPAPVTPAAPTGPAMTPAEAAIASSAPSGFVPTSDAVTVPTGSGSFGDDGIMGAPHVAAPAVVGPPRPAGVPPEGLPRPRVSGGGVGRGTALSRAPAPAPAPGMPLPAPASDSLIAGLAGDYAGPRRDPDLIDREMLLEQQRAGLARRDAEQQLRAEQEYERQRQALEQERQTAVAQSTRALQRAYDRVANARLDPARWFRDQGAGGTIGATIAVAMGALGQALTGSSTNSALDEIHRAVDQDLQAQQSEIDSGRAAADLAGNMLANTRSEFEDRGAALEAARAGMLRQTALRIQETTADLADQDARNQADALRAQLEAQAAEAEQAAIDREFQRRHLAAQTAREIARAQQDAIRAQRMGMPGTPRPPHITSAALQTYHQIVADYPSMDPAIAAAYAGLPEVPEQAVSASGEGGAAARGPVDAALRDLEQAIPAEGDIPGYGVADSRVPDFAVGDDARRIRMLARRAITRMLRQESGASITPDEVEEYMGMYGLGAGATEQQMREGVAAMRRDFDAGLGATPSRGADIDREFAAFGARAVD